MLRIEMYDAAHSWVMRLEGRLTAEYANQVETAVTRCQTSMRLAVDMTEVTFVDSAGEAVLGRLKRVGGRSSPRIRIRSMSVNACACRWSGHDLVALTRRSHGLPSVNRVGTGLDTNEASRIRCTAAISCECWRGRKRFCGHCEALFPNQEEFTV